MNELLQKFKDNVTRLALEPEDRGFFKNVKSWARTLKSALPKFWASVLMIRKGLLHCPN